MYFEAWIKFKEKVLRSVVARDVEREFEMLGIYDAKLTRLYRSGSRASFEIEIPSRYGREWNDASVTRIEEALNYISKSIESNYLNYSLYIDGTIVNSSRNVAGDYYRYYNSYGRLTKK